MPVFGGRKPRSLSRFLPSNPAPPAHAFRVNGPENPQRDGARIRRSRPLAVDARVADKPRSITGLRSGCVLTPIAPLAIRICRSHQRSGARSPARSVTRRGFGRASPQTSLPTSPFETADTRRRQMARRPEDRGARLIGLAGRVCAGQGTFDRRSRGLGGREVEARKRFNEHGHRRNTLIAGLSPP